MPVHVQDKEFNIQNETELLMHNTHPKEVTVWENLFIRNNEGVMNFDILSEKSVQESSDGSNQSNQWKAADDEKNGLLKCY